ncbi:MAG: enoyl-CoA hydratase [Burkholderiaceae bacterium]|nr:enoyl-CoA hydratase [Burkholderiaceae bacterium]
MSNQSNELVTRIDRSHVAYLSLNRPQQGNSLSLDMIEALHQRLLALRDEKSIAVIVLEGVGGRIFCAGHDLKEFVAEAQPEFSKQLATRCSAMMQAFRAQPQIIIAKVRGVATAAGCQLVASADLALAESGARFATPGVNIGLWCLTPMVAISRSIAPKHAMQMLATGRLFDADFALAVGLVNEVVESGQLDAAVDALANEIAEKSTYTLALGKNAFYRQSQMSLSDAYEYAGEVVARNMEHPDAREGIAAFVEKREPNWMGR